MGKQVNMPILANNKIKENNMTKNKNVKLSNSFVKYVKFVDSSRISYNECQQREVKLSEKVDIYLTDFTLQTIEFVNTCKVKKELITAKKYAIKSYAIHGQSESRINLAFRIAGSDVIKTKLKENKGDIKAFSKSIEKELKVPFLSQTNLNKYKNDRKVNNNKIELKGKKEKVQSKEKPKSLLEMIKSLSNEDLNNIIDLASQELAVRGQKSMTA
jgi:hypothetical protein